MRWLSSTILVLAVLLSHPPALARSLTIQHFDSHIVVDREGGLLVTETLTVRFDGKWNGLERFIPLESRGSAGERRQLELRVLGVSDEKGAPLQFKSELSDSAVSLRVHMAAADAVRIVAIRYRVTNGVRHARSTHEVHWGVTGDRWRVHIQRASVRLHLPSGAEEVIAEAHVTRPGSKRSAVPTDVAQGTCSADVMQTLLPGDGLEFRAVWKGGLNEASAPQLAKRWLHELPAPVRYALLSALVALALWACAHASRRLLLPRRVETRQRPPARLSPAELSALLGERAGARAWLSTLVDLAVKGHIMIHEHATPIGPRFEVQPSAGPERAPSHLERHEECLLKVRSYPLDEEPYVEPKVRGACQGFRRSLQADLRSINRLGLPPYSRRCIIYLEQLLLFGMAIIVMATVAGAAPRIQLVVLLGSVVVTWLALHGFANSLDGLSERARRTRRQALGFAAFSASTPENIRKHHSERSLVALLPHAIAVGNEANWLGAFRGAVPCSNWYRSAHTGEPLSSAELVQRLETLGGALPVMNLGVSFINWSYVDDLGHHFERTEYDSFFSFGSSSSSSGSSSSSDGGGGGGGF